jgi:hypothetical protein
MKVIVIMMIKNLFSALMGKAMFFWGAEFAAGKTDNLVDDNVIAMGKAAYDNDPEKMIYYAKKAIEELTKLMAKKDK